MAKRSTIHLITYAASVTRKMLHFNRLDYYSIPSLPTSWEAPTWLTIELGVFAGRLYFEYNEYDDLCRYLGSQEVFQKQGKKSEATPSSVGSSLIDEGGAAPIPGFTKKPLTFLQEWLSLKRKGQDFVHTPIGYVCQAKSLTGTHPFFNGNERNRIGESIDKHNDTGEVERHGYSDG